MPQGIRHRLLAILAADAVGYSRSMSVDDLGTLSALDAAREVFRVRVESHGGRVVDTSGDSILAVFETAIGAVRAAVDIQKELIERVSSAPRQFRLLFRIGIHVGDLIEKADGTVYGDGVNIASRLQAMAAPGGIVVSHAVEEFSSDRIGIAFESIGEQVVKNIAKPIIAFRLLGDSEASARVLHGSIAGSATQGSSSPKIPAIAPSKARGRRLLRHPSWKVAAMSCMFVFALVAAVVVWKWPSEAPMNLDEELLTRRAVAVLAFNDKRGRAAGSTLGDDVSDRIGAQLARSGVRVIQRDAVAQQDVSAPEFERIGREQAVRFVLGGRVIRDTNTVRVTSYVTEAASGEVYRLADAVFNSDEAALQSNYAQQVATALSARYYELESAWARLPGHDRDPADAIVLAWRDLDRGNTREDLERARRRFEFAIRADPNSMDASIGLGVAHLTEFYDYYSESPSADLDITEKVLKRALSLGQGDAQNLSAWAEMLFLRLKPDEAFWVWQKALEIDPDYQIGHLRLAGALVRQGRIEEATEQIKKANDLQAYQTRAQQLLLQCRAEIAFAQGHDDEAYQVLRNWAAEFPNNGRPYMLLAAIDALHGRKAAAASNMAKHRELLPLNNIDYVVLTYPSTDSGFLAQRDRLIAGLRNAGLPEGQKK